MNLWKKLNHGRDFVRATIPPVEINKSTMEIFLNEEFKCGVCLLQTIHKHFSTLNKICKGLVIPSENHLAIGYSLLNYEVSISRAILFTQETLGYYIFFVAVLTCYVYQFLLLWNHESQVFFYYYFRLLKHG